jgi:hypothetical protein
MLLYIYLKDISHTIFDNCTSKYDMEIVRVIKSRIMRWVGYVARMGKKRDVYSVLVGKPEGKTTGKTQA